MTSDEATALTTELRKLRQAIERNQKALMSGKEAAAYLGRGHSSFYQLVSKGIVPQTRLDPDNEPQYARVVLDRLIESSTEVSQ